MEPDFSILLDATKRTNRLLSLLIRILLRMGARAGLLDPKDTGEYRKELAE